MIDPKLKTAIDEMLRVQKTMSLAAILIARAFKAKDKIHSDQFLDILKLSIETLTNTVQYEIKLELADKITTVAPPQSIPAEVAFVLLHTMNELDSISGHLKIAHERMGIMGEMLRDIEGKKETIQ